MADFSRYFLVFFGIEIFLWARILSGGCWSFPRGDMSVNILVPTGSYWGSNLGPLA